MRVPLSWLRQYVDFDLSVEELVQTITLHSQEIDGVYRYGVSEGEVVVGEVREFGPHPNADRLSVAKVDLGGREVQIVAGAPNPYPGARVPVVLPGSVLADGRKLKKAKLRGLESYGMMMSERELGVSGDHEEILLLDDSYEVGRLVEDYFPVGEVVLDIDVTPNRPDLWGVIGVAREVAAILKTNFRIPEVRFETGGSPTGEYSLRVEAEELCPRYDLRRVSGVDAGRRTPIWMRRWIFAAGMRPINPVVDASNFTMLETGQPNHAFDAAEVRKGIVVRRAREGETMTLLDGSTRTLDPEMLVIADEERGLVIAGVMGAEDAEVGEGTRDVLVEVATFNGRNIFETSARLGLRTDASGRNERGLDQEMVPFAMDRVTSLIAELTGGQVAADTLSNYPNPIEPRKVSMRLGRAELLLGMPVEESEAKSYLTALGCEISGEGGGTLSAVLPTFRRDLGREADLIEEVGRLVGLDKVPEVLPATSAPGGLTSTQRRERLVRYLLSNLGLSEAVLYPFGPDRWRKTFSPNGESLRVENPLNSEAANLRTSLLPGLLDAAARNRAFGSRGGGLFEVGHVFEPVPLPRERRDEALAFRMTGEKPSGLSEAALMGVREPSRVGGVLAGEARPAGWNVAALRAGFFEVKGFVERLIPNASFERATRSFLHPGRSAVVKVAGEEVGWLGEVHPEVIGRFDLEGWQVAAFELDLAACEPDPTPRFSTFQNVPAVHRDLALVVGEEVPAGELLAVARAAGGPLLESARVFDVYEGEQVPEGEKSVALGFVFQGEETLTDEAVNARMQEISSKLEGDLGARVRS